MSNNEQMKNQLEDQSDNETLIDESNLDLDTNFKIEFNIDDLTSFQNEKKCRFSDEFSCCNLQRKLVFRPIFDPQTNELF